ncbi:pentapeptide repeat-containing protein [[Clostridium] colinum]|uniref:pentapeptide repeat-containing protein n=1 Tax=[Clostridium] colinum TaxID=36835 RepID=UPI002023E324|nr:pentapeptide repeat-containing protein [[Clostridium] colinum]
MIEYIPEHFYSNYFEPILKETLENLEEDFQQNIEEYKKEFILNFKNISEKIKKEHSDTRIGYLSYNLMLTKIINKNYKYDIYIYDKEWYLKGDIKIGEYNVEYIYKHYQKMWDKLLKEGKGYIFKINNTDINNIMLKIVDNFHKYIVSIMRNSIIELTETEEYNNLNKENIFNIHSGKFYDIYDLIYTENFNKNPIKIKKWLNKKLPEEYCNKDFKNLVLNNFNLGKCDLRGADFRKSELKESDLSYSILNGAKFKEADLRNSNIISSFLSEVNFENADLSDSKMTYCIMRKGKINDEVEVGYLGANLINTNLTNVDFRSSRFEVVDFRSAIIENTNFEECIFQECKFKKEQILNLNFTKEQLEGIKLY